MAAIAVPVLGLTATAAAIAAGVSVAANVGAQLTASKPGLQGSVSNITIGADQPTPYMIGDTYCGGAMVHKTGYGAAINKVDNPYLAMAVVYSAGGPIAGIDQYLADFEVLTLSGANGEAQGYFSQILFAKSSNGPLLQTTALSGPWGTPPGWPSTAKLSGKAHTLWSLKWDSKNGKYQSGAPQLGIRGRGVLTWDPRKDSTWAGGSGPQRWASPKDRAAFDAARATWVYTNRPGLHALRYALGTWERDLTTADSDYVLSFGIGIPIEGLIVSDFIELENICDANGWTVAGVLYEPGDKMANLKRILEAGGAEPCWKGGKLGLRLRAPRISLDTITRSDLADGEIRAAGTQVWEQRINAVIPKFRSPDNKWELQATGKKTVADYVTLDGEEKLKEVPFECVTGATQATQLALYTLYDSREFGPVTIPVKPRLRRYTGGDRLTLSNEVRDDLGLMTGEVVVLDRSFDPVSMTGTLTLMTDMQEKHPAALGSVGTAPPAIYLPTAEEYDAAASGLLMQVSDILSDSVITAGKEKRALVLDWQALESQFQALDARYVALGSPTDITTARADAYNAYVGLAAALSSLNPAWDDVNSDTPVNAAALNNQWASTQAKIDTFAAAITGRRGDPGTPGADAINNINLVSFARMEQGVRGWRVLYASAGVTASPAFAGQYQGSSYIKCEAGVTGAGQVFSIGQDFTAGYAIPVASLSRLAVQVGVEGIGPLGSLSVVMQFRNAAGNGMPGALVANVPGNTVYNTPARGIVDVPAGAVDAFLEIYGNVNGSGTAAISLTLPMITVATADQTEFPAFAPGPEAGAPGAKGDTGAQGPQGPQGATGATGAKGRDAIVFRQNATPTGQVVGDTWVTVSLPRVWRQWDGGSWVQILGDVAALSIIDSAYIADLSVGTAKIADLSVGTLKVANNAITNSGSAAYGGSQIGNGSWQSLCSYTINLSSAATVFAIGNGLAGAPVGVGKQCNMQILADGTVISGAVVYANGTTTMVTTASVALGAGSHTFELRWQGAADLSTTMSSAILFVQGTYK